MTAAIEEFERRYVERARDATRGEIDGVLLGRETDLGQRRGRFMAGWWCRPGSDPRVAVLPNPWDDRPAIALYDEHAWELTRSLLRDLAQALDELHGQARPIAYWDLLLVQWLHGTVTAALDRRLFVRTVGAIAPGAPCHARSIGLTIPATLGEAADEQLHDAWNIAFLRQLAVSAGLELVDLPAPSSDGVATDGRRGPHRLTLLAVPRALGRSIVRLPLERFRGRRIALLGADQFAFRQLRTLAHDVPGLRIAPRRGYHRRSLPRPDPAPARQRLKLLHPELAELGPLLPALVPLSVLEGHPALTELSNARFGPPSHVLHRNYAWDDLENEFLGRSAAAGKTVAFGQHGGATFQLAVAPTERHMYRDGRRYISWGARLSDNVAPAADPYVQALRDTGRGGTSVLLVEWMVPPYTYVYRFTSTPLGNQVFAEQDRLVGFVQAAAAIRPHLLLKGFPGPGATAARHPALNALPLADRHIRRPAPHWMRGARLVVCTYPDTPFIEAMAMGVPTLGLWDTRLWEMRDDAAPHFDRLERLGIVHSDPARCAAKACEVYPQAERWWASPEVASARREFLGRFAIAGDWRRDWGAALREVSGDRGPGARRGGLPEAT